MALSNAERQKAYRARKREEVAEEQPDPPVARPCVRCLELEDEVRHLKAELAKRPRMGVVARRPSVSIDPGLDRKTAQANRDAILRRINRSPSGTSGHGRAG